MEKSDDAVILTIRNLAILFIGIMVIFFHNHAIAVEVGGNIAEHTTWTKDNSPYVFTSTVQILENATLVIEPGVEIRMFENYNLNIGGELIAIGTEIDRIVFTSFNGSTNINADINFLDSAKDAIVDSKTNYISGCILKYCDINKIGRVYISKSSPFLSQNTFESLERVELYYVPISMYVKNCLSINNNSHGLLINSPQASIHVIGNIISNNKYGIVSDSNTIMVNNSILSNSELGIQLGAGGNFKVEYNNINLNDRGIIVQGQKNRSMMYNNIIKNRIGIEIEISFTDNFILSDVSYNNIYDNSEYNVEMVGCCSADVYLLYNWWGTTDSSILDTTIFDYYDDISFGKVIYEPIAMQPYDLSHLELTITSPNGGETLNAGTTHEITWISEGDIDFVKIEYSVNNGTDWIEIEASTENDGSYIWEVPCDLSDEGLVGISDVDGDAYDESDEVFSIEDQDSDIDGTPDCLDNCPNDPNKIDPGICGCGTPDTDSDGDGTLDCNDGCPNDPNKTGSWHMRLRYS